jgi:hypothetical protein
MQIKLIFDIEIKNFPYIIYIQEIDNNLTYDINYDINIVSTISKKSTIVLMLM